MGLVAMLPRGSAMSEESWRLRHRILTGFLWAEVPVLLLVGLLGPTPTPESLLLPLVVAAFGVLAALVATQRAKAELTSLGLIAGSFIGIELSGGQVHAHLFILAVLALVALYQRWTPLLFTVGAVVVHHLTLGLLEPERVFHMGGSMQMVDAQGVHTMAVDVPFLHVLGMVVAHALAVVVEVVAILLLWHFAEAAEREAEQHRGAAAAEREAAERARLNDAERVAEQERLRAEEASRTATRVAQEAAEIRDRVGTASSAIAALDEQAAVLREAVREVSERTQQAASRASSGQQTADTAAEEVRRLERAMGEISEVNQMIAQLAGQTNLLSLNATIEAARAGELGKGFAVVAQEVKALATETAASADKIRGVIEGLVEETGRVARSFATTSALVGDIHAAQTDIAASVERQSEVLEEVARQTATASAAAGEITQGLTGLLDAV